MLVRNCVKKDWLENSRSLPPCMPSAMSGPREEFGCSTVKIEGMNDARNQKWEEKSTAKSEQISTLLHYFIEQTWLLGQFHCPSQAHPGA